MKNWKTLLSGAVAALPTVLTFIGVQLPIEVVNGITAIGMFAIGYFAKDKNVTGGTIKQ